MRFNKKAGFFVFIILFNISKIAMAEHLASEKTTLEQNMRQCLEEDNESTPFVCQEVISILQGQDKYSEAYQFTNRACDKHYEACSQIYFQAEKLNKIDEAFKKMAERCENDVKYCEDFSYFHKEKKAYSKAIQFSKKYFEIYFLGSYPSLEYKYGDKDLAFTAATIQCEKNAQYCSTYLRDFKDHPDRRNFLKKTEEICLNSKNDETFFSSDCIIVGIYYYKKGLVKEALKFWKKGCSITSTTCEVLIGATNIDDKEKLNALNNFCLLTLMSSSYPSAIMKSCHVKADKRVLSDAIIQEGKRFLQMFLDEQKD